MRRHLLMGNQGKRIGMHPYEGEMELGEGKAKPKIGDHKHDEEDHIPLCRRKQARLEVSEPN